MPTAKELRKEFTDLLDSKGLKYQITNEEDNIVRISFEGREQNGYETEVFVDFDENKDGQASSAHFASPEAAKIKSPNLYATALLRINDANRMYRWCKFYLASKGCVSVDADAKVYPGTCGDTCLELVLRISTITEDVLASMDDLIEKDEFSPEQLAELNRMLNELFDE